MIFHRLLKHNLKKLNWSLQVAERIKIVFQKAQKNISWKIHCSNTQNIG